MGVIMILWGGAWVWANAVAYKTSVVTDFSETLFLDCCVYQKTSTLWLYENCPLIPANTKNWNVTQEFRTCCMWGVWAYGFLVIAGVLN